MAEDKTYTITIRSVGGFVYTKHDIPAEIESDDTAAFIAVIGASAISDFLHANAKPVNNTQN